MGIDYAGPAKHNSLRPPSFREPETNGVNVDTHALVSSRAMPSFPPAWVRISLLPLAAILFAWLSPSAGAAQQQAVEMFNGRDFAGWVIEGAKTSGKAKEQTPIWSVQDGMIHCTGQGFGFLRYDKLLKDFIFEVEYRASPRANSGIGIRSVKYAGKAATRPSFAAYEIQILDDAGKAPTAHSSGSLYRYVAPKSNAARPAGQWNQIRIECRGPKIRVTLNGQTIHDLDQTKIEAIKDKPLSGYVLLQSHTRATDFRHPRLQELNR